MNTTETWWPVTVTWPDGTRDADEVLATDRQDAYVAAATNWPEATVTVN